MHAEEQGGKGSRAGAALPPGPPATASKVLRKTTCKKGQTEKQITLHDSIHIWQMQTDLQGQKAWAGWGRQVGGMTEGNGAILEGICKLIMIMVSGMYIWVKIYQIVQFKYVQFTVCQSYLNHNF